MDNPELYIGLLSGTSADGVDCVLAEVSQEHFKQLTEVHYPYPKAVRERILALSQPGENEIDDMGCLDRIVGEIFAEAANTLLTNAQLESHQIKAIGSHGQTIRHRPLLNPTFTCQIGDPNTIALLTGIDTVADFRRKDMVLGGEGAPLVPAFHQQVFTSNNINRIVLNIGGIANITVLDPIDGCIAGFDCGPGNTLMDQWVSLHHKKNFDSNGTWAASCTPVSKLLECLKRDPYFQLPAPKSTGREYFNLDWLHSTASDIRRYEPGEVQATLLHLTAETIKDAIKSYASRPCEVYVCGGGAHNAALMSLLQSQLDDIPVMSTSDIGIHPDWVEANAFAWLAHQRVHGLPGNVPAVTGASRPACLGGLYSAN